MQPWSQPLLWKGAVGAGCITPASYISTGPIVYGTSSDTSMTATLPDVPAAGDLLIAASTIVSTRNPTWSAGWTPLTGGAIAYKIAAGGDAAPIVTFASGANQVVVTFHCGKTLAVGNTQANQAQTGTSATCPAVVTTANTSRCWGIIVSGSPTRPSLPAGWTDDAFPASGGPTTFSVDFCHVDVATSGSSSPSITSSVVSGIWRTGIIEGKYCP